MKLAKQTLLAIAVLMPAFVSAEPLSDAEAEYLSGNLCTLSQRMAKDYMAVGAGIRPEKAMKDLDVSVAQFEQSFQQLMDYANSHRASKEFKAMADLWQQYRTDVIAQPDKKAAITLINESNELLKACLHAADAITKQNGSAVASLVELSGEEATLTQKIAMDYFALYWHLDDENIKKDFQDTVSIFDKNLQQLVSSGANTEEISKLLEKIQAQWKFSNTGFQMDESGHYVPTVISVTTDSIYGKMEDVAVKYDEKMEKGK